MKTLLTVFTLLLTPLLLAEPGKSAVKHLDPKAAAKLLATAEKDKKPVVLDVRTAEEFQEGHLKGAVNVDYRSAHFQSELGKLDKKQPYLVHCRSGGRSTQALKVLTKLGFENLYHLDGGMLAWEEAEQEVVK